MKNLLIIFLLAASCSVFGQLNGSSERIKKHDPEGYKFIKDEAIHEWGTDHEMVVYRINNQCEALLMIIKKFTPENTSILHKAIRTWSYDWAVMSNMLIFQNEMTSVQLDQMLRLHVDWEMVEYEYDNQLEAKKSY